MPRTSRARATSAAVDNDAPATVAPDIQAEAVTESTPKPRRPARRRNSGSTPSAAETSPAAEEATTAAPEATDAATEGGTPPVVRGRRTMAGRGRSRRSPIEVDVPDAGEIAAAEAPSEEPPTPAPETPSEPAAVQATRPAGGGWRPRRPYTVDASGRVIYLDEQASVTTPAPAPPPEPGAEAQAEAEIAPAPEAPRLPGPRARRPRPSPTEAAHTDAPSAPELAPSVESVIEDVVLEPDTTPPVAASEDISAGDDGSRRRRRSRRGGRGRRRNGATPEGAPVEDVAIEDAIEIAVAEDLAVSPIDEAPAPPASPASRERRAPERATVGSLESLVARQNVILEQLMNRQERMAQSMESALKTMEGKLRGTDLSRVSAMPRLAVFVDVPNIVFAADRYRVAVDFGRLLDYVSRDRTLIRASAYAPISDDPTQRLEDQRFVEPFVRHGYRIVTKPLKRFADGSIKANFDVELAMDILTMSDRLDIVSLVSGDGDFRRLVDLVASKGVRVEVVAFSQSTSADLKAVADSYIDLTQHLRDLCNPMEGDIRERRPRPKVDISGYTAGARIE